MLNERKWLLRSNQTALEVGTASFDYAFVTRIPPGPEQAPNPTYFHKRNVETPYRSLRDSRLRGLPMAVRAQDRGKSECPAVMDGIRVATSPDAKAGRLPRGLSSPESLQNHLNGRKANERSNTGACTSGVAWNGINWADVQRQVRRLQTRMVKAVQAGRHNRVKALQWLLTHSFNGRALAVKRVTENKGRNTPGVDKVTWKTPAAKANAIASLKRRGYSPLPLRRVFILKKNGKTRPLGIPVMKCRAMQALHLLASEPVAETTADLNSYGFRPERSTADAGGQCFISLAKKASAEWVLEADIQGCFDKISHDWMIANIPTDKVILKKWLKAGYVYQNELFPTDAGTPQGGIRAPATT
jgi:hypothetical protein